MTTHCGKTGKHMGALRRAVNMSLQLATIVMVASLAASADNARAQPVPASPTASPTPLKLVAFGDSLSAGYRLAPDEAFPVVLGKALTARGYNVEVINAGVSGDTTSAGRDRLAWAVPPDADAVILELGANDALRGLDPTEAKSNLGAIITKLQSHKVDILLAGMLAPRSMGQEYTKQFDPIFPNLATKHGLLLYPFFLEKTALDPKLSLPDGLHPNARGVEQIVAGILPKVEELIARVQARRAGAVKG